MNTIVEQLDALAELQKKATAGPWQCHALLLEPADLAQLGRDNNQCAVGLKVDMPNGPRRVVALCGPLNDTASRMSAAFIAKAGSLDFTAVAAALRNAAATAAPVTGSREGADWRGKVYNFPGYMKYDTWKPMNDLHYSEARGCWVLVSELRAGKGGEAHIATATDEEVVSQGFLFPGYGVFEEKPFMPSDLKEVAEWATGLVRGLLIVGPSDDRITPAAAPIVESQPVEESVLIRGFVPVEGSKGVFIKGGHCERVAPKPAQD